MHSSIVRYGPVRRAPVRASGTASQKNSFTMPDNDVVIRASFAEAGSSGSSGFQAPGEDSAFRTPLRLPLIRRAAAISPRFRLSAVRPPESHRYSPLSPGMFSRAGIPIQAL